ncbi:amino acid ABC transporter permease [Clostridium tyrobutyricum]|uniref:amino acid ABC transporter permease n=1 Tax=Clostridium tyrobutyricum TaxID=1519 RepID=UPI001C3905E0|nr:amino acid ABC transporter permease [Clostridium tyrobutyricum]MBV4432060.1 amino acid ABC transporter permease [Clostridium tyrobutyricum]
MPDIMDITGFILKGSIISIKLFLIVIVFSIPLGMICALGKMSKIKILRSVLGLYTWAFRGTPLLLQLFFIYFGLPVLNIKLDPLVAACIAFIINYTAYLAELFRSGINSVDIGQYEAAKALGMNYPQIMKRIIIPQAVPVILPSLCNESINLIKDTSLVASIGIGDLLRAAKEIVTSDFTVYPFIIAGVMYLIITSILVFIFKRLEARFSLA